MKVITPVYLDAVKFLGDLEGGGERFELLNQGLAFFRRDEVSATIQGITGEPIQPREKKCIEDTVAGIVNPHHHNLYFDAAIDAEEEFGQELGELLRDIAFTFITAWTHRYGGFCDRLKVPVTDTVIDPNG